MPTVSRRNSGTRAGRGGGASSDAPDADRPSGASENASYCQPRTICRQCPDKDREIPDTVRAVKGRFGAVLQRHEVAF